MPETRGKSRKEIDQMMGEAASAGGVDHDAYNAQRTPTYSPLAGAPKF